MSENEIEQVTTDAIAEAPAEAPVDDAPIVIEKAKPIEIGRAHV